MLVLACDLVYYYFYFCSVFLLAHPLPPFELVRLFPHAYTISSVGSKFVFAWRHGVFLALTALFFLGCGVR